MNRRGDGALKRALDIAASVAGLVALSPVLLVIAVLVRLDSPGPALFRHRRVGRDFRDFEVIKFRTMTHRASGRSITSADDVRITRVGSWLRRSKVDELPQLLNVLRGEMSLVGPRPEVREYVELEHDSYRIILTVRPGITDPASLEFCDEQAILAEQADPEDFYRTVLLPKKLALSTDYVRNRSLAGDLKLIAATVGQMFR